MAHTKKHTNRHWNVHEEASLVLVALLCSGWLVLMDPGSAATTGESICVSVSVVGPDGGDPGNPGCVVASGSGASSQASSSATSSAQSSYVAGPGVREGGKTRRNSLSRIHGLLREWARPRHGAAGSSSSASSRPARLWYQDALDFFISRGFIDASQDFRPADSATRAEAAKLIVLLSGARPGPVDATSYDDTKPHDWFAPFMEEAGKQGWMIGYGDCFGFRPCYVRPTATITRAEAAAIIVRFWQFEKTGDAPEFVDIPSYAWYHDVLQTAADHCIIQGEPRPDDLLNRAEMVTMFWRAELNLRYGTDCAGGEDALLMAPIIVRHRASPDTAVASLDSIILASSDGMQCMSMSVRCVAAAIRSDIGRFIVNPFLSSLRLPDAAYIQSLPVSEPVLWVIGLIWLLVLMRFAAVFPYRLRRKS